MIQLLNNPKHLMLSLIHFIMTIVYLQVLDAFNDAEKRLKPNPELLFTDVYDEMPERLKQQMKEMKEHVTKYSEHYPLKMFEEMKK